jgi:hypothetical protein
MTPMPATRPQRLPAPPLFAAALFLVLLLPLSAAWAHHGWSGYHTNLRTLSGQVDSYEYIYPHAVLRLTFDGKPMEIVLAPPSRMDRRGLEAVSIKPGDQVSVQGYVNRQHETEMRAERVTVNGQTFELR